MLFSALFVLAGIVGLALAGRLATDVESLDTEETMPPFRGGPGLAKIMVDFFRDRRLAREASGPVAAPKCLELQSDNSMLSQYCRAPLAGDTCTRGSADMCQHAVPMTGVSASWSSNIPLWGVPSTSISVNVNAHGAFEWQEPREESGLKRIRVMAGVGIVVNLGSKLKFSFTFAGTVELTCENCHEFGSILKMWAVALIDDYFNIVKRNPQKRALVMAKIQAGLKEDEELTSFQGANAVLLSLHTTVKYTGSFKAGVGLSVSVPQVGDIAGEIRTSVAWQNVDEVFLRPDPSRTNPRTRLPMYMFHIEDTPARRVHAVFLAAATRRGTFDVQAGCDSEDNTLTVDFTMSLGEAVDDVLEKLPAAMQTIVEKQSSRMPYCYNGWQLGGGVRAGKALWNGVQSMMGKGGDTLSVKLTIEADKAVVTATTSGTSQVKFMERLIDLAGSINFQAGTLSAEVRSIVDVGAPVVVHLVNR